MNLTKNFTLVELNFRDLSLNEAFIINVQALAENLQVNYECLCTRNTIDFELIKYI
jgi:hypothetical protein